MSGSERLRIRGTVVIEFRQCFHENFGVEAGYVDLGTLEFYGLFPAIPDDGTIKTIGTKVAVVGYLPFGNPWHPFGKVGASSREPEEKEAFGGSPFSDRESGTDTMYGFGIQIEAVGRVDVRMEWERYEGMGIGSTKGDGKVGECSFKPLYRFY